MAWHYMAKPNHYQQNLSYSYGEKLRALTREAKSCIKVHEMLVEIGKGSGGKGSADRKGYGSKPKAISELEETNPIAGPSFGPWQISSSKNSLLVQTFKPLSGKNALIQQLQMPNQPQRSSGEGGVGLLLMIQQQGNSTPSIICCLFDCLKSTCKFEHVDKRLSAPLPC